MGRNSRKKKAIINTVFSVILEIVTVVAGFILPRLFIKTFGSDVNGLVSSISSFIGYITLLQSGVGTVAKASMYKPLAEKDHDKLCVIVKTVERFFRKIALITIVYIFILGFIFPTIIAPDSGSFLYTSSLVLIIGVSTAAQYFFGITHQMLLEADQKSYVYSILQISTVIINTVLSVCLIKFGYSVQIVKLGSALVFVLRPLALSIYSKNKYQINNNVKVDNSLIKQRWDGFAQAIAYFIHSKTDIFVLTVFARLSSDVSLSLVSVYSVYHLVTTGLTSFIKSIDRSVTSALGNIIALGEKDNLYRTFNAYNNFMHMVCTTVFATASIAIFKFVKIYIKDVTDVEYIRYAFGYIIIAAEYLYCLRAPYNSVIYAAGKFKETRNSAVIEAIVNIILSVALVTRFGLTGIAIGTISAMAYRTVSFMRYLNKNILCFSISSQIKRYLLSFAIYSVLIYLSTFLRIEVSNYFSWFIFAGLTFVVCGLGTFTINLLFMNRETLLVFHTFIKKRRKK